MNEKLETAIKRVLDHILPNQMKSDDALKFSQAALNLMNASLISKQLEPLPKTKGGS